MEDLNQEYLQCQFEGIVKTPLKITPTIEIGDRIVADTHLRLNTLSKGLNQKVSEIKKELDLMSASFNVQINRILNVNQNKWNSARSI